MTEPFPEGTTPGAAFMASKWQTWVPEHDVGNTLLVSGTGMDSGAGMSMDVGKSIILGPATLVLDIGVNSGVGTGMMLGATMSAYGMGMDLSFSMSMDIGS